MNIDLTELRGLLDELCEETITAERMGRLEEIVLRHPEAEAYYVQYVSQFAHLAQLYGAPQKESAASNDESQRSRRRRRGWRRLGGALGLVGLAAAVLVYLVSWFPRASVPQPRAGTEAVDSSVAVIVQVHEAEWESTTTPTKPGVPLSPGWLHLKSGFAHLEFYSGATVILQGPADLQLISRSEAYCSRGKLRATVPPQALGFTITSPKLELVDRGTEFGLAIGANEQTEVHVFQGKVELYDPKQLTSKPTAVTSGKSIRVEGEGLLNAIPTNPQAFQTAQGLAELSMAELHRRQAEWRSGSDALRHDPSLLVYYTFEPEHPWSRMLSDLAPKRKPAQAGAIVGCSWTTGRWPGKSALEFRRVSDRVRLRVPGEFESLTYAAWVRVDSLPNLNDSLMMTDGWKEGAPHWQLRNDGTLILGVQSKPKGKGAHYHADNIITPDLLGQWLMLAVVYDRGAGMVTHYLNGQAVSESPILFDIPLRIGDAELGNWNLASHHNNSPVRYFSGCMDEFMLFSRPLSAEQIAQLYAQGRPPT